MKSVSSSRAHRGFLVMALVALPLSLLTLSSCNSSEGDSYDTDNSATSREAAGVSDPSAGGTGGFTFTDGQGSGQNSSAMNSGSNMAGGMNMGGGSGGFAGSGMPQQVPGDSDVMQDQRALMERRKVLAQSYLDMGRRYQQEGRLQKAAEAFANATKVDPSNAEAQRLYSASAAILGNTDKQIYSAEGATTWDTMQARIQQASLLARDHIRQGRTLEGQGDFDAALDSYRKALIILQANPNIDSDFDEASLKAAIKRSEANAAAAKRDAEATRLEEIARINQKRDSEERAKVERRVNRMWDEALQLFDREKFSDAERKADSILRIDPGRQAAAKLREAARRAKHQKANQDNIRAYRNEWQNALQEVKDLAIVQTDVATFPNVEKWSKIIQRGPIRGFGSGTTQESEVDADVRRRLEGTTLASVDWADKTLDEAIRFVHNQADVNIMIMRAVEEAVPEDERTLSLTLESEISAANALNLAVTGLNLTYRIEDGIVKIMTLEMARKTKVTEFYEVRDLTSPLANFPGTEIHLNPSGFGAGVGGFDEDEGDDGEENRVLEVDRLIELIRQTVDPTSWEEDPDNTAVDKNGTLVVRQTAANHRLISRLLADLRKATGVQVQIESRFISVENNFLQDIGVDFRGLGDNSGGIGQPGRGTAAPFDDFGLPGAPTVLGTDTSAGAFYSLGGGNGDIRGRTQNLFDLGLGNSDVLTPDGGFSLQYTYLDDTQLEAILRAVQKYERVNTVTAPTLLVFNTQRASLQVTNHVAYVKDFDVEIAQAAVIADPVVDVVKEGVVLDVRPIVSNDRRFVTLELRPSVATLTRPLRSFTTSLGTGSPVTFEVPELKKESLKTTVVMPDGGTLLLGGLKFYEEQDLDVGTPILKDIPILNFFFSRKGKYTNLRDLIVLLRVKVVILEESEPGNAARGN